MSEREDLWWLTQVSSGLGNWVGDETVTEMEEWKEMEQGSSGQRRWVRWGDGELSFGQVEFVVPTELKEDAPSKQGDVGMELKAEMKFGSH